MARTTVTPTRLLLHSRVRLQPTRHSSFGKLRRNDEYSDPSGASRVKRRVEPAQFGARVVGRELPVDAIGLGVPSRRPGSGFLFHRRPVGQSLTQALPLEHAQLECCSGRFLRVARDRRVDKLRTMMRGE